MIRATRRLLTLAFLAVAVPAVAAEAPLRVGTSAGPYAVILDHVAAAAVNMNYAVSAGLDPKKALVLEDKDSRFALVFTTRARDKDDPRVARLIALYRSPEVKQFILDRFGGSIIPTW